MLVMTEIAGIIAIILIIALLPGNGQGSRRW